MTDNPARVVQAAYDAMNARNLTAFDRLYAPDVRLNGEPSSPAEIRDYCAAYLGAFADLKLTVEPLIAADDWVAARVVSRGTHTAPLGDLLPTGTEIEVAQHDLIRVSGGRIVECWTVVDQYAMYQQLGALPVGAGGE